MLIVFNKLHVGLKDILLYVYMYIRYSDWLRAGRSGNRIPVEVRFSAPVQTSPGAHPAPYKMSTGFFPGLKSGRGVTLTPHPHLVPWSWQRRAIPLLPLWAVRPVQSLSACTRVHCTFTLYMHIRCYEFYDMLVLTSIIINDTVVTFRWISLYKINFWTSLTSLGMCWLYLRHHVFT